MYPKMQSCHNKDMGTNLRTRRHSDYKTKPTEWSTFQEDIHDSGLDSVNLPSLNLNEMEELGEVISLENEFLKMQIDNGLQTYCHDSGVYVSGQYNSHYNSEDGSVEAFCDREHVDGKINEDSECEDNKHDTTFKFHIPIEQVMKLYEGDKDGDTKLHLSIINGHIATSFLLINIVPEYDWLSYSNHLRQTPLHLAVLTHQPAIVRRLVCAGATVLAQDKQGDTPLHIACRLGHEDTVKLLLTPVNYEETLENIYFIPYQRVPQDLTARNFEGQTFLHVAANASHHKVVQMLLGAGADINSGDGKSGRTVLHLAADRGDTELVELLLSCREIIVNKQDYAGLTPLHLACGRNHINIAKTLYALSEQDIFLQG